MKAHTTFTLVVIAGVMTAGLALSASSAIAPRAITTGERCSWCNRPVTDLRVAGETLTENNVARTFRTVRCMLTYMRGMTEPSKDVFVVDGQTGQLINAADAVYVPVAIDAFTGEKNYGMGDIDYVAFKSTKIAERFAAAHGVLTISWPAVQFNAAFLPVTVAAAQRH